MKKLAMCLIKYAQFRYYLLWNIPVLLIHSKECTIHRFINNGGSIPMYYEKSKYIPCLLHCIDWVFDQTGKNCKTIKI